jgi:hypothetical protein
MRTPRVPRYMPACHRRRYCAFTPSYFASPPGADAATVMSYHIAVYAVDAAPSLQQRTADSRSAARFVMAVFERLRGKTVPERRHFVIGSEARYARRAASIRRRH